MPERARLSRHIPRKRGENWGASGTSDVSGTPLAGPCARHKRQTSRGYLRNPENFYTFTLGIPANDYGHLRGFFYKYIVGSNLFKTLRVVGVFIQKAEKAPARQTQTTYIEYNIVYDLYLQ